MRKKFTYAILLAIAACIAGCNNEDDITDIFMNRTWTLAFFNEGTTITPVKNEYKIRFYDSSFSATTPNGAIIAGNWEADGKSRTFRCTSISTNGNISSDTTTQKMKMFLQKANEYAGDITYLQIKQQKNVYMQFYNR